MPNNPKQLKLFARTKNLGRLDHGGDTRLGLRKEPRPFSPNASMHLVLKARRAQGSRSMLHRRNRARVEKIIYTQAARAGIRVYRFANVGNHLHLLTKSPSKSAFQRFLKAVSGLIARQVANTERGHALVGRAERGRALNERFWLRIPYSRLVTWGREYNALKAYLGKNRLEAAGFGGAKVRITPQGEAVIVVGDPNYKHGAGLPPE